MGCAGQDGTDGSILIVLTRQDPLVLVLSLGLEYVTSLRPKLHSNPKRLESTAVMPARMVYEWDTKRDVCYDMYIAQNKSLEDVIKHFRDGDSFTPR